MVRNSWIMVHRFSLALLVSAVLGLTACTSWSAENNCWTTEARLGLLGDYIIVGHERYGGSPLTEEKLVELTETGMRYREGYFGIRDTALSNPRYVFRCEPAFVEGEVPEPSQRRSNFYGFGTERSTIKIIEVYAGKETAYPLHTLEWVDHEVWELYAGWLLRLKKK